MTPTPATLLRLSAPRLLLHSEGLLLFLAAVTAYAHLRGSLLLFIALLLVPDMGMLGYLRSPVLGSFTYNLVHTFALPSFLLFGSLIGESLLGVQIALIWFAHIGMDRAVGYGLKYGREFKATHMERL
ncbi:MAG TPA: DUF4260 family protein [Aggregatilineales bacterium]|nr:DUF4260 family protein [Anaerolineales bacterium]HRE48832.1 DUF4260 family protein [Aggregatilineales bacterium]